MAWTQLNNFSKVLLISQRGSRIRTYECLKHSEHFWLSNTVFGTIWMMSQASHLPQVSFLENLHQSWLSSVIHPCYTGTLVFFVQNHLSTFSPFVSTIVLSNPHHLQFGATLFCWVFLYPFLSSVYNAPSCLEHLSRLLYLSSDMLSLLSSSWASSGYCSALSNLEGRGESLDYWIL